MPEGIVITGAKSGLGRFLYENLGGLGVTRSTVDADLAKLELAGADVIIHCAFNRLWGGDALSMYGYVKDNVLLSSALAGVPHEKFIYLSSIEVYPKNNALHSEAESLGMGAVNGLYGAAKLMSEAIVAQASPNHVILRAAGLLGGYSRRNTVMKLMTDHEPELTLTPDSSINCVLYEDVLSFIKEAIKRDEKGIFNLASSANATVEEIAAFFGKRPRYGSWRYDAGMIDNLKARAITGGFQDTSMDALSRFASEGAVR
ncbi:MAG: NAD-dependent epimerase/dehydratase family protein [Deltaproteobacteria bacterium]|nr:NAD-dependent epimerase/dehydratase family protein [Deltaproteobacteria bacterium]